jgi:hypothetical protein
MRRCTIGEIVESLKSPVMLNSNICDRINKKFKQYLDSDNLDMSVIFKILDGSGIEATFDKKLSTMPGKYEYYYHLVDKAIKSKRGVFTNPFSSELVVSYDGDSIINANIVS